MSYSYDLRKRVEAYVLEGGKKTDAARLFRVHVQTIHNWMRMKGGVCSAGKPGPKTGRAVKRDALNQAIAAHPDARLKELAEDFQVHPSTIFYACKKWGITRKKRLGATRSAIR
jgi:transposase